MLKKYLSILSLAFIVTITLASPLRAQEPDPNQTGVGELKSSLGTFGTRTGLGKDTDTDLKGKVANVVNVVLGFLGVVALIMIITSGFKWMMAGGNEETVKEARDRIKNATIGLAIVFASYIIVNFAVAYLGRATGAGGTNDKVAPEGPNPQTNQ